MFKKVGAACGQLLHEQPDEPDDLVFSANDLNDLFQRLSANEPTLTLQWCNVLILLRYDDEQFWSRVMMTEKKHLQARSTLACTCYLDHLHAL